MNWYPGKMFKELKPDYDTEEFFKNVDKQNVMDRLPEPEEIDTGTVKMLTHNINTGTVTLTMPDETDVTYDRIYSLELVNVKVNLAFLSDTSQNVVGYETNSIYSFKKPVPYRVAKAGGSKNYVHFIKIGEW